MQASNIIQKYGWIDGLNYDLNVSGDSMFGAIQVNGQDSNNIFKRVGALTIASASIDKYWETRRLYPYGISTNTSLYVTGFTTFNDAATCASSLNMSGTSPINSLSS